MSDADEQLFEIIEKKVIEQNIFDDSFIQHFKKRLKEGSMKEENWTLLIEKQVELEERKNNVK